LDHSLQSKIVAMAFSMAAEIERDLISQRTKEALRVKKAAGVPLGRPKGPGKSKLDPYRPEIEALLANGSTKKFIADRYRTTSANLHNWLKKHGV
jgi:DNA invertase Pin-like site-specific DNA recombinase